VPITWIQRDTDEPFSRDGSSLLASVRYFVSVWSHVVILFCVSESCWKSVFMIILKVMNRIQFRRETSPFHFVNVMAFVTSQIMRQSVRKMSFVSGLCLIWVYPFRTFKHILFSYPIIGVRFRIWGCIQKFRDWVDNEINNSNKHMLRSKTKGYGGKTLSTDSQNSDTTEPSGRELYHEEEWGSGGIAPRILNFCTRWRWVVSFTPWSLFLPGKSPRYPVDRMLVAPQIRSGRGGEEK
jgi:hypothetical protein